MVQQRTVLVRLLVFVLITITLVCLSIALYGLQSRLPAGLTVDGWDAGGLPWTEFEQQLADKKLLLLEQPIQLVSGQPDIPFPPSSWTTEQLGLQVSLQDVLDPLAALRAGSPFERAISRWRLRNHDLSIRYEIDAAKLHTLLIQKLPAFYEQQPVNAQRIVGPTDTISYVPELDAIRIDETALLEQLKAAVPQLTTIRGTNGQHTGVPTTITGASVQHTSAHAQPAPDADKHIGETSTDKDGGHFKVTVTFAKQKPALTLRMLQDQGVDYKINEFTTTLLQNSEGRLHNIRSTAAAIHDLLLKPGDVFDYAAYIALTEAQYGFKEAPVILNGKLVPGIGGGICQVSSTLYNAVLRAGLTIVERRNHSLPVSYVPLGQDATFAAGHINFQFRNSTEKYLLIRTSMDDQRMTVKLFGHTPPDITYTVESTTVRTLQPETKYVANPNLPSGKQQTISEGKPGYVVDTFRYKKQNGQLIGQERISQDTYAAQPTVIAIRQNAGGTTEPEHGAGQGGKTYKTPLIEDGVKGPTFR
jgi:vancomycin resistance protein YoaR